jgi:hypothetical protein
MPRCCCWLLLLLPAACCSLLAARCSLLAARCLLLAARCWLRRQAATFEHALAGLDAPRADCPLHLPEAPPPSLGHAAVEASLPINDLQRDIAFLHAHLSGADGEADHASSSHSAVPRTQGEISEWMQRQYAAHAAAARYNLTCDVARREGGWTEDTCVRCARASD